MSVGGECSCGRPCDFLIRATQKHGLHCVSGTATHVQLPRQLVGDRDGDPGSFLILLRWRRGFARSPSLCEKDKRCLRSKFVWYVDILFVTTQYCYVSLVCAPIVLLTCDSVLWLSVCVRCEYLSPHDIRLWAVHGLVAGQRYPRGAVDRVGCRSTVPSGCR